MRETLGQKKPKLATRQNIVYLHCYYWRGSSLLLLMPVQINLYLADAKFLTLKQLITYTYFNLNTHGKWHCNNKIVGEKKKKPQQKRPQPAGIGNDIPFDSCILKPACDLQGIKAHHFSI